MADISNDNNKRLIIFQGDHGEIALKPDVDAETLWITQRQLSEVFDVDVRTVNEHIGNIFRTGELDENPTIRKFRIVQKEGSREVERDVAHYNLDMAISVGYRMNSTKATKFRKWATSVLRTHITDGYTVNAKRIMDRQHSIEQAIENLKHLQSQSAALDVDQTLELIKAYSQTWLTLDRFDREDLANSGKTTQASLDVEALERAVAAFRSELIKKGEASELFASEKEKGSLRGIVGNVMQNAFGSELYPSLEEKAAHLLYFIVKNHPFNDGNKRTGAFAFIWFLKTNGWAVYKLPETALASLTLLIATSDPQDKKRMVSLILELLGYN